MEKLQRDQFIPQQRVTGQMRQPGSQPLGQGMVEFALAIPVVLMLVMGIIEGGRLLFLMSDVSAASREAARYGAGIGLNSLGGVAQYLDCNGIISAAERIGAFAGVQTSNVTVAYDKGPGTTPILMGACPDKSTVPSIDPLLLGDRVSVRVDVPYQPLVPMLPIPSFHIVSENARTIVSEVDIIGTPAGTQLVPPTNTPNPTATHTPAPTNTPVPPTPTNTPEGATPIPPTNTPTITPTPTATHTPTIVPSPTPGGECRSAKYTWAVTIVGSTVNVQITNNHRASTISRMEIRWAGGATLQSVYYTDANHNQSKIEGINTSTGVYSVYPNWNLPMTQSTVSFNFNSAPVPPASGFMVKMVFGNNFCFLQQ